MDQLNRRSWLKTSALGASAISFNMCLPAEAGAAITKKSASLYPDPQIRAYFKSFLNHWGPSDKAKKAILENMELMYMYPKNEPSNLWMQFQETLAKAERLTVDHLMLGAGSSELLGAVGTMLGRKGGKVIYSRSYPSLPFFAEKMGAVMEEVPIGSDYLADLETMEAKVDSKTVAVHLVNPGYNGIPLPVEKLKAFCAAVSDRALVVIDEAYIGWLETDEHTMIEMIRQNKNVVVSRTMSKFDGMSGLRMGYLMGLPDTIAQILDNSQCRIPDYKYPYTLSRPALAAALATYRDQDFIDHSKKMNFKSREFARSVLSEKGYEYLPGETNWVIHEIKMDHKLYEEKLKEKGIYLYTRNDGDKNYATLSMATMAEMEYWADNFDLTV